MSFTSGLVFYAIIWALVFYMVNPLWQVSQREAGKVVPGTPESAPVDAKLRKKAIITTVVAAILFGLLYWVIEYDVITLDDLTWMEPPGRY
ncbi:DUF1467 family protein [Limibaculum sp. M0105]|uniref:DUF1467 family protein n=1 Tax=Thermohalobaculum xanthum TaxID=2753746 RepID=A0A8J7M3S1_9RHOB|nr:DUF1467 family protein [Thermohalobaculum xanthum]MBK0397560.1 DUF1467 family protein [Thermohalobaculum xanthum]